MGNQQPGAGGFGGPGGNRNIEEERKRARERRQEEQKRRQEAPARRVGKKKKKGVDVSMKLPQLNPVAKCRLRLLRAERTKDYLLMEEEFIKNQEKLKPSDESKKKERAQVDELRGRPM